MVLESMAGLVSEQQFRHWKTMFEHLTGLQLSRERDVVAKVCLEQRIAATECESAEHYLGQIQDSPAFRRREWDTLIEQIVIGETQFFRYQSTFSFIGKFVAERLRGEKMPAKFTAWSAGCSSGEEAFSLAMIIHRVYKSIGQPRQYLVVGTDINGRSLKHAAQGEYRNILDRGVDDKAASAFFEYLGGDSFRIKEFLRSKVAFFRHNILEPVTTALIPEMDLISCQNVLMYLQPWRRRSVIRHLVSFLRVDGVLVLCPGDISGWKPDNLERIPDQSVLAYRRIY